MDADFALTGSHAYGAPIASAPNPCLHVGGLGILGLPLSERDARLMIENCDPARQHGQCDTLADRPTDVWEIEPPRITFVNPAWNDFMADTVATVCKELGVAAGDSPPRCELSKLTIHTAGSTLVIRFIVPFPYFH